MDKHASIYKVDGKWLFNDVKQVKVSPNKQRVLFQRKGKYIRGLSISKEAFSRMEDVTIKPGMRIEVETNVWLSNYGKDITLVKYCLTRDNKRCDGGFFQFTPQEWSFYWRHIRKKVMEYFDK